LINSKIKERDTAFLAKLGFKNPDKISKLKIEPIIDPYNFVKDRTENFELLKLMAEDGSMEKVLKDQVTSKNYAYHKISFSTKGIATDGGTLQPLLNALNDSDYFRIIQKKVIENIKVKIQYNDQTLNQINDVLNSFSGEVNNGSKNANLVYYNENTNLDEVLKAKYNLVSEQGARRIELVNSEKIVKDVSIISNIEKSSSNKYLFPVVLLLLFVVGQVFFRFYKKQALLSKERAANL